MKLIGFERHKVKYKKEGEKLRDGGKEREIVVLEVDGTITHLSKQ